MTNEYDLITELCQLSGILTRPYSPGKVSLYRKKKIITEQKITKHFLKSLASSMNIVTDKSIFQRYPNVASKENLFSQLRILESQS